MRRRSEGWLGLAGLLLGCASGELSAGESGMGAISTSSTGSERDTDDSGTAEDDTGTVDDTAMPPPPDCDPGQVACGNQCADLDTDPSNCGDCGRSCVIPQAIAACEAGECVLEGCDPGYSECDGQLANGCETPVDCQAGQTCSTSCGSQGTVDCTDVCAAAGEPVCTPPAEVCNAVDDDCNDACDEGALPGCRVGVHRSNSPTLGHFYTTDLVEAQSGDLNLESENYFWLYTADVGGLQPLFRCIKPNGKRWLTSSTDCEGTAAPELTVGFMSMDDSCGATPLYRLLNAPPDAHFYTVSAPERDNAVDNLGFIDEGIAGYVWSGA
ncbi:MAG: hypothetical protein AB1Z98_31015 [Nannocystaceae bacterium]